MLDKPRKNKFLQLWLIIGIIAGFASILFFSITYLNEKLLCDLSCRSRNEVTIILILLSLFGMFIGSFTYYFMSEKYEKKIIKIHKDVSKTLNFLDEDAKLVLKILIYNKGELTQAKLVSITSFSRVKLSRLITFLENKGIIKKTTQGYTNQIVLEKEYKDLFFN